MSLSFKATTRPCKSAMTQVTIHLTQPDLSCWKGEEATSTEAPFSGGTVKPTKLLIGTKASGDNTNVLVVDRATSNVGIGTQNPGNFRLAVNGPIRAKEIVVETGWSDFVFDPDYKLRSLKDLEVFISEHGHLPDIPSAEEGSGHGVKVGEIESKLLRKVEELTLHLIAMHKRVGALEQENARLRSGPDPVATRQAGAGQ